MRFGSVCSGIEAASAAFNPLGWKAAWFSEIEPFPCSVLAYHYPDVQNFGDMTTIARRVTSREIEAPDMLCGGTPCQSFSVAGLRKSMDDARGNLALEFIRIADAIDDIRRADGKPEAKILWENVPGVLSTKDNAFGAFLGGLCGSDAAINAPADGWPGAGVVAGPSRVVAWRILDAQYFGVPQRRRRVFVLALGGPRKWSCADALLSITDSLSGNPAPSRKTGQSVTPTIRAGAANGGPGHGTRSGDSKDELIVPVAKSLRGQANASLREDSDTYIPIGTYCLSTGQAGAELGADVGTTLNCNHEAPIVFDTTQITSKANYSNHKAGDPCHPLAAQAHVPAIAFPERMSGTQCASTENLAPSMGALNPTAVAYSTKRHNTTSNNAGKIFEERTAALDASSPPPALLTAMQVRRLTPMECERLQGFPDEYTNILHRGKPAADGPRYRALGNSWAVPNVRWIGERLRIVNDMNRNQ